MPVKYILLSSSFLFNKRFEYKHFVDCRFGESADAEVLLNFIFVMLKYILLQQSKSPELQDENVKRK